MTEESSESIGRRVRPTVMVSGDGGGTTFVDLHDLHPVNETSATVGGAVGGGVVGGAAALLATAAAKDTGRAASGAGFYAFIAAAVGAVIGGVLAKLNAQTHNRWSDRITAKTLEAGHKNESQTR